MKNLFNTLITFGLIILTGVISKSQILNENFNLGMPLNWNQNPGGSWNYSSSLGTGGSGCFYAYEANSNSLSVNVSTSTLNLSGVTNLTVSFQVASVANNFLGPDMALYYDEGVGRQFIARWGSGFNNVTTHTITYSSDYQPPLDSINVNWIACTHTISPINAAAVKFIFEAEIVNGGYALLDDIVIAGTPVNSTGLINNLKNSPIVVIANPTINKHVWIRGEGIKEVFISDNLGKCFKINRIISHEATELNLESLACGIYYLSVVNENNELIHKKIILE